MPYLQIHLRECIRDALPVLIHHFHPQPSATLGLEVVINQVLVLEVALADAAWVVLAQDTRGVSTARAPAISTGNTRAHKQVQLLAPSPDTRVCYLCFEKLQRMP